MEDFESDAESMSGSESDSESEHENDSRLPGSKNVNEIGGESGTFADWDTEPRPKGESCFTPKRTSGSQRFSGKEPAGYIWSELLRVATDIVLRETNIQGELLFRESWKTLAEPEYYDFCALLFATGIVEKETLKDYWTMDVLYSTPGFRQVMSRDRFLQILRSIHLYNTEEAEKSGESVKGSSSYDPLHKCRSFVAAAFKEFLDAYAPGKQISIDEQVIPFMGKFAYRVVIKNKPEPMGIKVFAICDAETGYCFQIHIYCGEVLLYTSERNATYAVVWHLLDKCNFFDQGMELYLDNYYVFRILFEELLDRRVYCVGTVKASNMKGLPTCFLTKTNEIYKKMARGDAIFFHTRHLTVANWKDRKNVILMWSLPDVTNDMDRTVRKVKADRDDGQKGIKWTTAYVKQPVAYALYNKYMGGVDLQDQCLQYSWRKQKTVRWYIPVFRYVLNTALCNTRVFKRDILPEGKRERYHVKTCRREVIDWLLKCGSSSRMIDMPLKSSLTKRKLVKRERLDYSGVHLLQSMEQSWKCRKKCVGHMQRKDVWTACATCEVPLCLPCHTRFHTEEDYLFNDPQLGAHYRKKAKF